VLANNGEVVEICALTEQGMIVRNATEAEGLVPWRKIQSRPDAPVRLTYGYATDRRYDRNRAHPRPASRVARYQRLQGLIRPPVGTSGRTGS
jgi:hypothetical protein